MSGWPAPGDAIFGRSTGSGPSLAGRYAMVMPHSGYPHVNPDTFNAISPCIEDMPMMLEEILQEDTDNAKRLRYSLTVISDALKTDFSEDLNVIVKAFSSPERLALPLVQIVLTANNGDKPYSHSADCTLQRYIVGGEIQVVRDRGTDDHARGQDHGLRLLPDDRLRPGEGGRGHQTPE